MTIDEATPGYGMPGCRGGKDAPAPPAPAMTAEVETLAAEFHTIYQTEAKRQDDVRHHDDYAALPENIKEFDRVLARHVLAARQSWEAERAGLMRNERERCAKTVAAIFIEHKNDDVRRGLGYMQSAAMQAIRSLK